jgi:hypothetical protein
MELIFNHLFGKQEHQDLVLCHPMARVSQDEEPEAINTGWLALDHPVNGEEIWYQSRSTRVDLSVYKPRFPRHEYQGKRIEYKIIDASEMVTLLGLPRIYREYMKSKNFSADYNPFQHFHKRDQFMIFYIGRADNIVGFTKQKRYGEGDGYGFEDDTAVAYESVLHACSIPISHITLDIELKWARGRGMDHYLLGSGYEQSSAYKSKYKGFEWWTGAEWSTSRKQYNKLCRRDSRVETISEIASLLQIQDKT